MIRNRSSDEKNRDSLLRNSEMINEMLERLLGRQKRRRKKRSVDDSEERSKH